tara:strand:- start:439 stop:621 length:183 start_codon:yes stop_codon:yes gene_type:complete
MKTIAIYRIVSNTEHRIGQVKWATFSHWDTAEEMANALNKKVFELEDELGIYLHFAVVND